MASSTSDSNQPLSLEQQKLNSVCDEESSTDVDVVERDDSVSRCVAETDRSDKTLLSSSIQEHVSLTSSCAPQQVLIMNGSAESIVGDKSVNIPDMETNFLPSRSAENTDSSAAYQLDVASHNKMQSVSVDSHSSLMGSSTVTPTDSDTFGVVLSSGLLSQAGGISVADTANSTNTGDCQAASGHLVSEAESKSSASLDATCTPRLRHDRHSVSSVSSETCASSINLGAHAGSDILHNVSISHSSEKLWSWPNRRERSGFDSQAVGVVRSSWSQENYFDDSDLTCVDIDVDDDDLASSVDVLHYRDTSVSSDIHSYSWTEDDVGYGDNVYTGKLRSWAPLKGDEVFSELFSSDSESSLGDDDYLFACPQSTASSFRKKASKTYGVGVAVDFDPSEDSPHTVISSSSSCNSRRLTDWNGSDPSAGSSDNFDDLSDDISFPSSVFSDIALRSLSKDVDRPSAARLAKRLYYLQGFRKSDISRHLTKKYDLICTSYTAR